MRFFLALLVALTLGCDSSSGSVRNDIPLEDSRKRLMILTDLGDGDPDDTQSMVHLLLYSDLMHIEGVVSGMPSGRLTKVQEVVATYEKDLPNLLFHSADYPSPDYLRSVIKQGSMKKFDGNNFSEGSEHIINRALAPSSKKLHIAVWGSITDLAQAIHDAPHIKQFITVTSSGGWNTRQDEASRQYLFENHPDLLWVEQDATGRGIYITGLNDKSRYGNVGFAAQVIRPAGHLGEYYYQNSRRINVNAYGVKMGDTPTWFIPIFTDLLETVPTVASNEPTAPAWGGRYCQHISRPTFWHDCPNREWKIGGYDGVYTVAEHRQAIYSDWESRIARLYPK